MVDYVTKNFIIWLGIANSISALVFWTALGGKEKRFSFKKTPFSRLAGGGNKILFNLSFLIYCLIEMAFIIELSRKYGLFLKPEIPILFLITPSLGVLTATKFDTISRPRIHRLFAVIGFASAILAAFLFAIFIRFIHPVVATADILLALTVLVGIVFGFARHKTLPSIYEYFFFGGVVVWSLINSLPIII